MKATERTLKWMKANKVGHRTHTIQQIRAACQCSKDTARACARQLGVKLQHGNTGHRCHYSPPGADWRRVDWSMRDTAIARALGVSRQRVGQQRRRLGK